MLKQNKNTSFYQTIHSFHSVPILYNTLVLCDLDETLWKYDEINVNWWRTHFQKMFNYVNEFEKADELTINAWTDHVKKRVPEYTDRDGFSKMLDRITNTNSDIIFITARTKEMEEFTKEHLGQMGDLLSIIPVHYVGQKQSKGDYILHNLDIFHYDHIVFIDDNLKNLISVYKTFWRKIKCFKFDMV